ncbi:unnamed protein product [Tuber aestivum]|uniref:Uncharacterized protein n=1 Tax=Tuber aestivum TaxID=59557 RepID=A0A292PY65_9PEZI|nr:unnamed protein product [Tuber aestivum]
MSYQHEKPQPSSEAALRSRLLSPLVIPSNPNGLVLEETEESQGKTNSHPTSLMRAYVHQKLSILPSLFKNYNPGVQYVRDLVAQDFEPQERPIVMRVFWDAFHGLDNDGRSPFPDVWMGWREQRQEALSRTIAKQNFNTSEGAAHMNQKPQAKGPNQKPQFNPLPSDSTTNERVRECAEGSIRVRPISSRQNIRAKLVNIRPRNSKSQINLAPSALETGGSICTTAPPLEGRTHRSVFHRSSISGEFPKNLPSSTPRLPCSEPLAGPVPGNPTDSEEPSTPKTGTSLELHHTRRKSFDWIKMSDGSTKSYNSAEAPVCLNLASNSNFGAESTTTHSHQSNVSDVASDPGGGTMRDFELRVTNLKESNPRLELRSRHFVDLLLPIKEARKGKGRVAVAKPVQSFAASPTTNSLTSALEREETERARLQGQASVGRVPQTDIYPPNIPQEHSGKSDGIVSLGYSEGGPFTGGGDELPTASERTENMRNLVHSGLDKDMVPKISKFRVQDHPRKIRRAKKGNPTQNLKTTTKILPRSLSATDKIPPSEGSVKVSHLGTTPEENEVEDIGTTTPAKPPMESGIHTGKAQGRWPKSSFTKAIGAHLGRKVSSILWFTLLVEFPTTKDVIANSKRDPWDSTPAEHSTTKAPFPTENPLQMSSSSSTPNIIQFAIPISHIPRSSSIPLKKLLDINNYGKHEGNGKPSQLCPWEGQHYDNSDNGSPSEQAPKGPGGEYVAQTFPAPNGKSLPAISISPLDQASLYGWAECTVVQACSDFLRAQQLNLDIALLGKEVKKWEDEKVRLSTGETRRRDKVIEFMFGMEIQCRLIEGNMKYAPVSSPSNPCHANISDRALHFSGPAALNPANIISAWKAIIPSFSPRTYCIPDYLILEHFRVLEKVLGLFGPVYYDAEKFESKRSELVRRIMKSGDLERHLLSMKRLATLREEREKAEEELLREVGLLTIGEEE